MSNKKRVLIVINTMNCGGAETFIMKVFREIVKFSIVFDFLINQNGSCYYEKEINELGGRIYYGVAKSQNIFKSMCKVQRTVKQHHYKKVFIIAAHPMAIFDILACRFGGIQTVLTRSTTASAQGSLKIFSAKMLCGFVYYFSDYCFAPSYEAAEWLYGKRNASKATVLKNGINISEYQFSDRIRADKRCDLGIKKDDLIIGHVGRFCRVKNHDFLLNVFSDILQKKPNAKLVLVGDGELKIEIIDQAKKLGIYDKVYCLGVRRDVNELYMMMDLMIFPSLYEGLPNVIVEAQATGLPCLISDTISFEAVITDNVWQCSLSDSYEVWAEKAVRISETDRIDNSLFMTRNGYDIKETAIKIYEALKYN